LKTELDAEMDQKKSSTLRLKTVESKLEESGKSYDALKIEFNISLSEAEEAQKIKITVLNEAIHELHKQNETLAETKDHLSRELDTTTLTCEDLSGALLNASNNLKERLGLESKLMDDLEYLKEESASLKEKNACSEVDPLLESQGKSPNPNPNLNLNLNRNPNPTMRSVSSSRGKRSRCCLNKRQRMIR